VALSRKGNFPRGLLSRRHLEGGRRGPSAGPRIAALGRLIENGIEIPFERFKQDAVDLPRMARDEVDG